MRETTQNFRIDKISIRNYKGIDSLDLEFPRPKFPNDPDIFVIGSRNGLGKTSVLECCALGLSFLQLPQNNTRYSFERSGGPLLRVSSESGWTALSLSNDEEKNEITFSYDQAMVWRTEAMNSTPQKGGVVYDFVKSDKPVFFRNYYLQSSNPANDDSFLFFPDHRFISKAPISLKTLSDVEQDYLSQTFPQKNEFKKRVLEIILGKSGVIEGRNNEQSEEELNFLNELAGEFADSQVTDQVKLHELENDTVFDVRVHPLKPKTKDTYSFDGLSSGQKEMISTLFLIWYCTHNAPKVVLIDEPEQHLNAEWHHRFVYLLHKIVPHNQYILATHSEFIASAVDKKNLIMLVAKE